MVLLFEECSDSLDVSQSEAGWYLYSTMNGVISGVDREVETYFPVCIKRMTLDVRLNLSANISIPQDILNGLEISLRATQFISSFTRRLSGSPSPV